MGVEAAAVCLGVSLPNCLLVSKPDQFNLNLIQKKFHVGKIERRTKGCICKANHKLENQFRCPKAEKCRCCKEGERLHGLRSRAGQGRKSH